MIKAVSILIIIFLVFLAGCIKDNTDNNYDNVEDIFKKAIETKNKTICDKAMGFSNRCYNQLARVENKPDNCRPVHSSEPAKSTCHYAPGDFTPNYCTIYTKYGGYEEDYGACVSEASDYDIKLCMKLNDKKQQKLCLKTVYLKKENLTDPEVCFFLEEKNEQDGCKLIIMNRSTNRS